MRFPLSLAPLLVACAAPPPPPAPVVEPPAACPGLAAQVDGDPAPHSAHHFTRAIPNNLIAAQLEVRVREMPDHGLRFFALQVDMGNETWAHGGLQGDMQANWGGLRRGIDYDLEGQVLQTLEKIQNLPGRTSDLSWSLDRWYRYEVRRGDREVLSAGEWSALDEPPTEVPFDREMWRWDFRITDLENDELIWTHALYTADANITAVSWWTETGYGVTCEDRLTVDTREPWLESESAGRVLPPRVVKGLSQSTCPDACTTDIGPLRGEDGEFGTTMTFGQSRRDGSYHGDLLYAR